MNPTEKLKELQKLERWANAVVASIAGKEEAIDKILKEEPKLRPYARLAKGTRNAQLLDMIDKRIRELKAL